MITKVTVQGFRGITQPINLELGDISLLTGRNGLGKTTVLEAVDWCLFGDGWKSAEERAAIRNLYSPRLEPQVQVSLTLEGVSHVVTRTPQGIALDGSATNDRDMLDFFVRDMDCFPPYEREPQMRLRRLLYLPQHEMRALLDAGKAEERDSLIQSILGIPNVHLLQSGLRRLESRLADRGRSLQERLLDTQRAIQDTLLAAPGIRQYGEPDRETTLREARQRLGTLAPQDGSPTELLAMIRDELRRSAHLRNTLSELALFIAETRSGLRAEQTQLTADESELLARRNALSEVEAALASASSSAAHRREAATTAAQLAQDLSQQAASLRLSLDTVDALNTARVALVAAEGARLSIQEEVLSLRAEQARRQTALEAGRERVTELEALLRVLREQERHLKDRRIVSTRLVEVTERTRHRQASLDQLDGRSLLLNPEIEDLKARSAALRDALVSLSPGADAHLTALLLELADATQRSPGVHCLLCGHPYRDHAVLAEAVQEALAARTAQVSRLGVLRTEMESLQQLLVQREQEFVRLESERGNGVAELQSLVGEGDRLRLRLASLPPAPDSTALEAEIEATEAALVESRTQTTAHMNLVSEVDRAIADAAMRLERSRSSLTTHQEILSAMLARVQPGLVQDPEELRARLRVVRTQQDDAEAARSLLDQELQRAAAEERALLDRVIETRTASEALRAKVEARRDVIRKLTAAVERRLIEVFAEVVDDQALDDRLSQERSALDHREQLLRASMVALDAIVMNAEQASRSERTSELRSQEAGTLADITLIDRARLRFEQVATAVRERADLETGRAVVSLQGAVQYFFRSLYPHRHLNEIQLRQDTSQVLLGDLRLKDAVRPDLYASTGQIGTLVLAILIATSLRQRVSRLDFLLLDEPIQNLDDLHFLALITLLRRIASARQVILSTADANIAELFTRQMKSSASLSTTSYCQYEWKDFDPETGPWIERVSEIPVER